MDGCRRSTSRSAASRAADTAPVTTASAPSRDRTRDVAGNPPSRDNWVCAASRTPSRSSATFFRSGGVDLGRDGCRVPLPWAASSGSAFGFGEGGSHLPQPDWFGQYAVATEGDNPDSSLSLYRRALHLRRTLQTGEQLEWIDTGHADVLRFRRPNGWEVVTNFGTDPRLIGSGDVLIATDEVTDGMLPGESTVWLAPRHS